MRYLSAKASPTRGGGIERSDDDGEVGQSNDLIVGDVASRYPLQKCSWLPGLGPLALRRSLPAGLPILLFCGGALLHFIIPPPPYKNQGVFHKFVICHKYSLLFSAI